MNQFYALNGDVLNIGDEVLLHCGKTALIVGLRHYVWGGATPKRAWPGGDAYNVAMEIVTHDFPYSNNFNGGVNARSSHRPFDDYDILSLAKVEKVLNIKKGLALLNKYEREYALS